MPTWREVVDALYPDWDEEKEGAESLAGFLDSQGVTPPAVLPEPGSGWNTALRQSVGP